MVVHPAPGNRDHTLVNALLAHCGKTLSGIGGVARPGIVHRLDKDTSGLMVAAKNDAAHQALSQQFADRSLSRTYQAVVWGTPVPRAGSIEAPIGRHTRDRKKMAVMAKGRAALDALQSFANVRRYQFGRMQAGDRPHASNPRASHAYQASGAGRSRLWQARRETVRFSASGAACGRPKIFVHPRSGKMTAFTSPMPKDMAAFIKLLKAKKPINLSLSILLNLSAQGHIVAILRMQKC